jgi:uncharacterized protein
MKNANPVSRWMGWGLCAVLLLSGCGGSEPEVAAEPKTGRDWFQIEVGGVPIDMQLAVTGPEMQQGLMGRKDLQEAQGMLFVYARPTRMSFWMRNTPTALDIGFFTRDGVLREIYPLHPFDERPVQSRREDLQYALEVLQGGFARLGIKPGDQLDLAALSAAMSARGFEPGTYGGLIPSTP